MFDLLTPGKKISFIASAGILGMLITAFVAALTETTANLQWAMWLGYYSTLAYIVILFVSELDLRLNKADIARVATCALCLIGTIGLVTGSSVFTLIVFFLALVASAAVVYFQYVELQQVNYVYVIMTLALFFFAIFFLIIIASRRPNPTIAMMAFIIPFPILAFAAGLNCYQILKEA